MLLDCNGKLFAEAVGLCTGGDLEIVVHGGGTLFKGGEIKRALQTGRAPIGERLLSAHQNENAVFGFDSVPFLASSFEASDRLWQAARGKLRLWCMDLRISISGSASVFESLSCLSSSTHRVATISPDPSTGS